MGLIFQFFVSANSLFLIFVLSVNSNIRLVLYMLFIILYLQHCNFPSLHVAHYLFTTDLQNLSASEFLGALCFIQELKSIPSSASGLRPCLSQLGLWHSFLSPILGSTVLGAALIWVAITILILIFFFILVLNIIFEIISFDQDNVFIVDNSFYSVFLFSYQQDYYFKAS